MKTVRIIKNWNDPDLFRQTPQGSGIWNGIRFTEDSTKETEFIIVLNYSPRTIRVVTNPHHVWTVQQEPPYEFFKVFHKAPQVYTRVYTTDPSLNGKRYFHSQPALPWHIDRTYDFLIKHKTPQKQFSFSFITSLKDQFPGHKKRLKFLEKVRKMGLCDIIATQSYYRKIYPLSSDAERKHALKQLGYTKIVEEKWDGLAPYKYSLIVENYHGPDYWSEKLADCFFAWTMPIYYGCTNLSKYFPKNSFIEIDIEDPQVETTINNIIKNNPTQKNRKAIEEARNLILNEYQFFPFITKQIKEWEEKHPTASKQKKDIILPKGDSFLRLAINKIKRLL